MQIEDKYPIISTFAPYYDPSCSICLPMEPKNVTDEMKQNRAKINLDNASKKQVALLMLGPSPAESLLNELKKDSKNFKTIEVKSVVMPEIYATPH